MDIGQIIKATHERPLMSVEDESVRDLITDVPFKFFSNEAHQGILGRSIDVNTPKLEPHQRELAEYIDIGSQQTEFSIRHLIARTIRNNFLWSDEMHPVPSRLTNNLHRLKNTNELAYKHLQKLFTEIFPDTDVRVEQTDPQKDDTQTIWITERQRTFELTNSASGYLEAIHILYTILNRTQRTIFLDEPEVHFHPAKIRQISQMLSSLTKKSGNQITVITHSPKFLDHGLLDPHSQSMLTMVTKVDGESSVASPTSSGIRLKPHMFMPDIFFANATFLVEGPGDESVIRAISDAFDGIFDRYEIAIVSCDGVDNIEPYIDLLKSYLIKYYGLADMEYNGDGAITVLEKDLEHELQKTMTPSNQPRTRKLKPPPEVVYSYVVELLETKDGFERLKRTKIWTSIKQVIDGIGKDMTIFEKKYGV